MLILCDFDGTFTEKDVTNLIWDNYKGTGWREDLPAYWEGRVSHLQIMVDGYKTITAPEEEMLTIARQNVRIRPGFDGLKKLCDDRNWELTIVSGGIDFYVRAFLPEDIPFYSYVGKLDKYWKISLPPGVELAEGADFKVTMLEKLKKTHPGERAVFIGDGRNDFPVAQKADIAFAVKGSYLARLCGEAHIPFTPFTSFDEITGVLQKLEDR